MLKSDLVKILIDRSHLTPKDAEIAVDTVFNSMAEAMGRGENIEIRGLGSFHLKEYGAYMGRNPSTKEKIAVAPKRGVLFRTGKQLKLMMNDQAPAAAAEK